VGPRRNRASGAASLQQFLDKRAADPKQGCQGTLGAEVCVIGTKDFLTTIEGVGLHAYHAKAWLPFIQLQTALGDHADDTAVSPARRL
jgi:hypothetical protein